MSFLKFGACAALAVTVALPISSIADSAAPVQKSVQATPTLNPADQRIHDYIMNNPTVLIQSLQAYQQEMKKKEHDEKIIASIHAADNMRNPSFNTVAGNPKGSVTLVEFFDYQCIMCFRVYKDIEKLTAKNKDLRVIFRLLPIFGKASVYAAKVDVAAAQQGKYDKFHDLMFKAKHLEGKLKDSDVRSIAKKAGVSLSKSVMKSLSSDQSKAYLKQNLTLARALKISGTPTFYIMPTKGTVTRENLHFFGGVAPIQFLQKAIDSISGKDQAAIVAKKVATDNKK